MSMPRGTKITCPNCGKERNFTIWHSVNVDSDPETREQVKNGKLFEYVCKECDESFNVEYKFLYHDSRNKFLIWYVPKRDYDMNKEVEEINNFKNDYFSKTHKQRIVDRKENLVEKIKIFENGLNDIIIEIIKDMILENSNETNLEVFFSEVKEDKLFFYMSNGKGAACPYETYQDMIKEIEINEPMHCAIVDSDTVYHFFV